MDSRDLPEEGLKKIEVQFLLFTWFNIDNMNNLIHNCCHKDKKANDTLFDKEEVKERFKNRKMYYQAIKSYCNNNIDDVKTVLIHSIEINLLQAGKTIRVLPNLNSCWSYRNNDYLMRDILSDFIEIYKDQLIKGYDTYCCRKGLIGYSNHIVHEIKFG